MRKRIGSSCQSKLAKNRVDLVHQPVENAFGFRQAEPARGQGNARVCNPPRGGHASGVWHAMFGKNFVECRAVFRLDVRENEIRVRRDDDRAAQRFNDLAEC